MSEFNLGLLIGTVFGILCTIGGCRFSGQRIPEAQTSASRPSHLPGALLLRDRPSGTGLVPRAPALPDVRETLRKQAQPYPPGNMSYPPKHPPIDFEHLTIDPERLERALTLTVEPFLPQPGAYSVTPVGREAERHGILGYWIDLRSPDVPRCTCADHTFKQVICKHMLACLLYEGEPHVVAALQALQSALESKLIHQLEASIEAGVRQPVRLL